MRTQSQLAYILHKRAFRDSSQILEVFTRDHGRLALLSRGSRSARSRQGGLLQLYRPLLIGWSGRGEMPLLTAAEAAEIRPPALNGQALISAMYINELITVLLHRHDPNAELFDAYHHCLYGLQGEGLESVLRLFEKQLLACLGFGLNLETEAEHGGPISADLYYSYHPEHGAVEISGHQSTTAGTPPISGASLLAYAADELESPDTLREIKQLTRSVLGFHLGPRKLRSRDLFRRRRR